MKRMSLCWFEDGGDNVIRNSGSLKERKGAPNWLSAKNKTKTKQQKQKTKDHSPSATRN